jgi:hypothetical protein
VWDAAAVCYGRGTSSRLFMDSIAMWRVAVYTVWLCARVCSLYVPAALWV